MELKVDSVFVEYEFRPVLRGVHLICKTGEIIGLLGLNGSGKSTLLKVIQRSLIPDASFVKVDDDVILSQSQSHKYITYLPQESFLPRQEKLKTVLALQLNTEEYISLSKRDNIAKLLNQRCGSLSGGESRFIEILMVLNSPAPFVLLDEPFNGLAPIYKDEVKELIRLKSQSKGIIITDHDYRNVLDISTKEILLFDGISIHLKDKKELYKYGYIPKPLDQL
ncbi:MAG: hypothetical protein COA58_04780 [Bacteroidetes bacterium]|nr:MAG: hypothetical protein COA58_04780 [Bacteroidota bacterium]